MSAKVVCVIPPKWTLADYSLHNCADRSHAHISRSEASDSIKHELVEIVRDADRRLKRKMIVRLVKTMPLHGLSSTVGAELSFALRDHTRSDFAQTMLAHIRMRAVAPDPIRLCFDAAAQGYA